ncbi:NAD(P)/FAD-dependent oxidoreductase [Pontibacillus marinus]|uniref:Ferredoxin--NADP reductase n=1 Tax=Pontibacillus marinus BH030004 = DSM 16465 TaxID=1385511 RepID=A0A0A5FTD2_9BACI|nr:NAD(P)/FAD-dependent oxidoreductase [Pontibacillus marinus]KGX83996.1 ferredoxin--NADP reductase [Pontibacillus marinus BH030004 = DSM 16465]
MTNQENVTDVTIIGGGPTGLFTAFYGGMRDMNVKIIDSLPQLGGQLSTLYPEKYIYDIAGFPKVRAQELVDNLIEQADYFNPQIVLEEAVKHVEKVDEHSFKIETTKDIHYSKSVVITAGVGAFEPRRLKLDGADQYEGKNLHYFINDLQAFKDQNVLITGGGDSAVDWALMLEPIAKQVTLIHRRDKFRAHEHSVEELYNSNVHVKTPYTIEEFIGDGEQIQQVVLQEKNGEHETLDVDSVIVNHGFISSLGPIKEWDLDIEKNSIVVNSKMETNIKGIYAAGDIATYEGKVKLIATGFGEAPVAVNNAKAYIDPNAKVQPKHSTSLF